jgi:hypothetical protein
MAKDGFGAALNPSEPKSDAIAVRQCCHFDGIRPRATVDSVGCEQELALLELAATPKTPMWFWSTTNSRTCERSPHDLGHARAAIAFPHPPGKNGGVAIPALGRRGSR